MDAEAIALIDDFYGRRRTGTRKDKIEFELLVAELMRCKRQLASCKAINPKGLSSYPAATALKTRMAQALRLARSVVRPGIAADYERCRLDMDHHSRRLEEEFYSHPLLRAHPWLPDGWTDEMHKTLDGYVALVPPAKRAAVGANLDSFLDGVAELYDSMVYYQDCLNRRTDAQLDALGLRRQALQTELNRVCARTSDSILMLRWWLERLRQRDSSYAVTRLTTEDNLIRGYDDELLTSKFKALLCHES